MYLFIVIIGLNYGFLQATCAYFGRVEENRDDDFSRGYKTSVANCSAFIYSRYF